MKHRSRQSGRNTCQLLGSFFQTTRSALCVSDVKNIRKSIVTSSRIFLSIISIVWQWYVYFLLPWRLLEGNRVSSTDVRVYLARWVREARTERSRKEISGRNISKFYSRHFEILIRAVSPSARRCLFFRTSVFSLDPEMRRQFLDTKFNKWRVIAAKTPLGCPRNGTSPPSLSPPLRCTPVEQSRRTTPGRRLAAVIDTLYLALACRRPTVHPGWTTSA